MSSYEVRAAASIALASIGSAKALPRVPFGAELPFEHPRPAEAVDADMRAEVARHAAVMQALILERAGATGRPSALGGALAAERRLSKKQAAHELGMTERRLMSLIVRYADAHPSRPRLAVQPAGMKNSPWLVYIDRVHSVIDSGEPY